MADRIQAQAIRRFGDFLYEIDRIQKSGRSKNNDSGDAIVITRKQAAENAGLSKDECT